MIGFPSLRWFTHRPKKRRLTTRGADSFSTRTTDSCRRRRGPRRSAKPPSSALSRSMHASNRPGPGYQPHSTHIAICARPADDDPRAEGEHPPNARMIDGVAGRRWRGEVSMGKAVRHMCVYLLCGCYPGLTRRFRVLAPRAIRGSVVSWRCCRRVECSSSAGLSVEWKERA